MPDYTRVGLDIGAGRGWLNQYRENWTQLAKAT